MDTEILIVGAGVFGLSIARALQRQGREVLVIDSVGPGAGASGTPLGVLAPHSPERWNEKKQAQFEALTSLADVAADLQSETGFDIGYRRCGRLIPLTREHHVPMWRGRIEDARENWQGQADLSLVTPDAGWLDPEAAPFGAVLCSLTARINARAYCDALAASVGEQAIRRAATLEALEPGMAILASNERVEAKHIILANGADAFRFLHNIPDVSSGRGEKGQAAILSLPADAAPVQDRPLIYSDRLYVVPHGEGRVSVGATSEREFHSADMTDELLNGLIERAQTLCPAVRDASVYERWARLRPRADTKRLLVGPHPTLPGVSLATGGFKTGLAMAHTVGAMVAEQLAE